MPGQVLGGYFPSWLRGRSNLARFAALADPCQGLRPVGLEDEEVNGPRHAGAWVFRAKTRASGLSKSRKLSLRVQNRRTLKLGMPSQLRSLVSRYG